MFVYIDRGVILSDTTFGGIYENEGGVLSVEPSNDDDEQFRQAIYNALIKSDATISMMTAVPTGFFSLRPFKNQHDFLNHNRQPLLEHFKHYRFGVTDYIFVSDRPDSHTTEAIQKAVAFLDFVHERHYPYSYLAPLLENYQEIIWTDYEALLYLLTRNDYFSRQEVKNTLSAAIRPFRLTLPRYDWLITGDR